MQKKQDQSLKKISAEERIEWIENNYHPTKYAVSLCPDCHEDVIGWLIEDGNTSYLNCDECGYNQFLDM